MPPQNYNFDAAHFLDLGPTAPRELHRYLQLCFSMAKANPKLVERSRSYRSMYNAAVASGDKTFLPLLRQFNKVDDQWIGYYAGYAAKD